MSRFIALFVATSLACILSFNNSKAAVVVTSTTSADLRFDLSGQGALTLNGMGYSCFELCSADPADPNWLATSASFGVQLGSTLGASDIGTAYAYNPFGQPITNIGTYLRSGPGNSSASTISVPDGLDFLFARLFFVDDNFGVSAFSIGFLLNGEFCTPNCPAPAVVPLPSALILSISGLGILGFTSRSGRRRRH